MRLAAIALIFGSSSLCCAAQRSTITQANTPQNHRATANERASNVPATNAAIDASADVAVISADADTLDAPPPVDDPPRAWSDPRVIEQLARDCSAGRGRRDEERVATARWAESLLCFSNFAGQSCSVDPCIDGERDPCAVRCGETCESCHDRCQSSCAQCRARCTDGACQTQCATTCAQCMDGCISDRDRCATGVCAREYRACSERAMAQWRGSCQRSCRTCTERCSGQTPACVRRCLARVRGCTPRLAQVCEWHGPRYGEREEE